MITATTTDASGLRTVSLTDARSLIFDGPEGHAEFVYATQTEANAMWLCFATK